MSDEKKYTYALSISDEALSFLKQIRKEDRRRVGYAMDGMQRNFHGDIKKLQGTRNRYRLRVGEIRVLFKLVNKEIQVYEIADRKDVYGN